MDSAYKIADEVALIHRGELLWKGKKTEMKMKMTNNPYMHQFIHGLTTGGIKLGSIEFAPNLK